MEPDVTCETCFTCCKKPLNFHKISDSDGDSKLNIRHIICQHFWFKEDDLGSAIVCETCWEKVDQFHEFYLDVKNLHEHCEVPALSMFIKQEEITIEETQLQENCMDISAENQKLFDITDYKNELAKECDELSKKEDPADVFPQPRNQTNTLEDEMAKCEFCGKCYRNKLFLHIHVKSVHKKPMDFICKVCSKGFNRRAMFLEHHKTHELTAEQLKEQCPVCNKGFKSHSNWLQHVRQHKEGECKCEVCGHVSIDVINLQMHMKYRHAPDRKRHVCKQCGKEYSRAVLLKEHFANAHTREHLYQCQYCEKKFFSSANMYSHRKKFHPQEWLEDHMSKYATRGEGPVDGETVSGSR